MCKARGGLLDFAGLAVTVDFVKYRLSVDAGLWEYSQAIEVDTHSR